MGEIILESVFYVKNLRTAKYVAMKYGHLS